MFRGRQGHLIKVLWWDGQGLCLFAKRLEKGRFVWPSTAGAAAALTPGPARHAAGRHRLAHAAAHRPADDRRLRAADYRGGCVRGQGRWRRPLARAKLLAWLSILPRCPTTSTPSSV